MSEIKSGESIVSGSTMGKEVVDILKVIIISLVIVLPIRSYVAQPFLVRGASMEPNFEDKDYLVIDELTYQFREPERGENIVFRYPRDPREFFIKRVIGLPGERVELKQGRIRIYNSKHPRGFLLDESYLSPPNHSTYPDMGVSLEQDSFFVLGDNRDFSSDSRVWGALPRELIVGRVLVRAWPITRLNWVAQHAVSYQE